MSTNLNLNQEYAAAENLLYQRLIIFLIVFSVFVIGAVNTNRKILFLSILFLGVLICWVLTLIIIRTAKRVDNKSGGKFVRIILGYLVPLFCSSLLTVGLFAGSFGLVDSYLFSADLKQVQLENKINELKNEVVKQISPPERKISNNFKNIDSVIAENNVTRSINPLENNRVTNPQLKSGIAKRNVDSRYFKAIDSVIVSDKPADNKLKKREPFLPPAKQTKGLKNFKNVDSVISKEK